MSVFGIILSILKAIPVIDSWFQQLVALYVAARIATMKKENRDAVRKAVEEHDQRDLEGASGSPHPGEHSGETSSEIIEGPPPGVNS
jgi:hypothetical protein